MEDRYIKISELAAKLGVSRQSVYRRLDKDLKKFVVNINGVKRISVDALYADTKKEKLSTTVTPEIKNVTLSNTSNPPKTLDFEKLVSEILSTTVRENKKTDTKIDTLFDAVGQLVNKLDSMQKSMDALISNQKNKKPSFWSKLISKKSSQIVTSDETRNK